MGATTARVWMESCRGRSTSMNSVLSAKTHSSVAPGQPSSASGTSLSSTKSPLMTRREILPRSSRWQACKLPLWSVALSTLSTWDFMTSVASLLLVQVVLVLGLVSLHQACTRPAPCTAYADRRPGPEGRARPHTSSSGSVPSSGLGE